MSINQPSCPGALYTIKAGDTFWSIARANNLSLDAIIRANPGINPDALRVGQNICLPTAAPFPGPPTCGLGLVPYGIQAGDTLWDLARRSGTTVDTILRNNPGIDPDSLRVGQIICIPPIPGAIRICSPGTVPYRIQPGDTLSALAQKTGTTVTRILENNKGIFPENLEVGSTICIPPISGAPAPPTGRCGAGERRYVVQAGDTYYVLAQRFGTTPAAIMASNPGVDPSKLVVGMIICIP
jgi:LysM repeat protein